MHARQLYDSWLSTPVPVPARSQLYALAPIGVGDAMVESLTGYVARLAEAHSVSVGDLVGHVLSDARNPVGAIVSTAAKAFRVGGHGFHACSYAMNGLADRAAKWVRVVESATTRRDLCCLTFLPFRFALSEHLFHRHRMWCSYCLEKWRASDQTIYEPLLWAVKAAPHCPLHKRPLSSICHHCGRKLNPIGVFSRPGKCERCGGWLGRSDAGNDQSLLETLRRDEAWSSGQVAGLLEILPHIDPFTAGESLRRSLKAYLAQVANNNALALAELIRCPRSILQNWLDGVAVPRLESLLRTARLLNVPVASFFEPSGPAPIQISAAKEAALANRRRCVSPYRNATVIRRGLLAVLREDPPRSLAEVARGLGYTNTERLYQADRTLCHKIALRYRQSGRSHWWRKPGARRICEVGRMKDILEQSLHADEPISVHQISASLGYSNDAYIQWKFPKLCAAIAEKISQAKQGRFQVMRQTLENALLEHPAPTLAELAGRLGFSSSTVLRAHEPNLCNQLATKRRADIVEHRADLERKARAALDKLPKPSVGAVCRHLGISRWFMTQYFPGVQIAIAEQRRRHLA